MSKPCCDTVAGSRLAYVKLQRLRRRVKSYADSRVMFAASWSHPDGGPIYAIQNLMSSHETTTYGLWCRTACSFFDKSNPPCRCSVISKNRSIQRSLLFNLTVDPWYYGADGVFTSAGGVGTLLCRQTQASVWRRIRENDINQVSNFG